MDKKKIEATLRGALGAYPKLFLLDLIITAENNIYISLDGDQDVSLEDCSKISRYLDKHLNRDIEDYTLEVSSIGVGEPLKLPRQYPKNYGRILDVLTKEGVHYQGLLKETDEKKITLKWTELIPKSKGKGKKKVTKEQIISYEDIAQAKVLIKF